MNNFKLRPFGLADVNEDYKVIRDLAQQQVPYDSRGNDEWLQNRKQFDEHTRKRRHYIAIAQGTDDPIGYVAAEQQSHTPTVFRLYLVFDPQQWRFKDLGAFMYHQIISEAQQLGATQVFLIEYAANQEFAEFLIACGFERSKSATYNGFEVVRFEKTL